MYSSEWAGCAATTLLQFAQASCMLEHVRHLYVSVLAVFIINALHAKCIIGREGRNALRIVW